MNKIILFVLFFISQYSYAAFVKGSVKTNDGETLPSASVYVKNTTYGTATNIKGNYFLELKSGEYTLVYSFIGYKSVEKQIAVSAKSSLIIDVVLEPLAASLNEVEIFASTKDKANSIIESARKNRKIYYNNLSNYSCKTYSKTSIEKETFENDTIKDKSKSEDITEYFKKENINLIESVYESNVEKPNKTKTVILAQHDYAEQKGGGGRSINISASVDVGENDIAPEAYKADNPYIIYNESSNIEFDFYKNLMNLPLVCQKPIQSPLATTSALNYAFNLAGSFYEGDQKIYKLSVKPRFKSDALFSGFIFIEDSTWALVSVDLIIDKSALLFCSNFRIIQNYSKLDSNIYVPIRREFYYTIKDGKSNIIGNARVDHTEYEVNKAFPAKFFNNEVKTFSVDAFDKDSTFWSNERTITLEDSELEYILKSDSIKEYYSSDKYYAKIDSAFNRVDIWTPLAGYGRRNRIKGTEFYIAGLPAQVIPFGVGGYRHKLPARFKKDLKNGMLLETNGFVDYGFLNQDIKGKLGLGLTYFPLKFVRTFITVGNYYDMINNYASIEQTFSRSNYVRKQDISISQRMEIINGLYADLSLEYSNQDPINNLQLTSWSEFIFRDLNTPIEFDPYTKTELKLEIKYRFNQKYFIKKNKKIIIGSDYPELAFIYRKGLPNLFSSEVNFDYIQLRAHDELKLARFGSSRWQAEIGTFVNKDNLRMLEHKYFRGSDLYFFSDPLRSFQLLGPTMNTRNEYFRANYIHHFEGSILNKVPLFSKLKLSIAGGAGTLFINDDDFVHFEMFAGLEKVFRIKKQLFRIGAYAVTADNALDSNTNLTFKVGIDFFNTFTGKWSY